MTHATFKAKLMIKLQQRYLDKIRIYTAISANVFYKTKRGFKGPFKIGNKGIPDLYGYIKGKPAIPFWIECKVGRDKLSPDQEKHKKLAKDIGILFCEARSFQDAYSFIDEASFGQDAPPT